MIFGSMYTGSISQQRLDEFKAQLKETDNLYWTQFQDFQFFSVARKEDTTLRVHVFINLQSERTLAKYNLQRIQKTISFEL